MRSRSGDDLEEIAAVDALGIGAGGSRHLAHHRLDLARQPFKLGQILAEDFDADGRADAGREHVDARLDRHGPGVADARKLERGIHFGDQACRWSSRPPLVLRLQIDDRLEHFDRRRIGRGLRAARLAPDRVHLRETT